MHGELLTIDDLDVDGRRVLLRCDLNVPLAHSADGVPTRVADDSRIRAALASIEELSRLGARLVLISDLGGPDSADPLPSMRPVAERLAKLTGVDVPLAPAVVGDEVRKLTELLAPGQILMLENVRFEPGETRNDVTLSRELAELADAYVDDAFAEAHCAHASNAGVAGRLPRAAGRLLEREVRALRAITDDPDRPLVAVLGGATVTEKVAVLRRLLGLADVLCIGGEMCLPFLVACGHSPEDVSCLPEDVELARLALRDAADSRCRLELPRDLVLGRADPPTTLEGLDIGRGTAGRYAAEIAAAATVFWDGAMGSLEPPPFAAGTQAIAQAVAGARGTTVVAGDDTALALRSLGLEGRATHVCSGNGAARALLEGRDLPAVQVLLRERRPGI